MIVFWFGFVPIFVRVEPVFFDYVFLISSCWVHIWKEFEDLRKRKEQWIKASYTVWCVECHYLSEAVAAPPPLTAPQHSSARAPPVRSLSLGLLLCPHSQPLFISLNTVSTECQCMCLCVCESFYHFYSQRVVCSVPFSVLDNRLPPNHLTAPHSARPLLDFRITSRKWVCSTCVKLSCAVFLLSQR